jgi:hypothetical protein
MNPFRLGIQCTPYQLFDEGLEPALDALAAAGCDAIHPSAHVYYTPGGQRRSPGEPWSRHLADDHPPRRCTPGPNCRAFAVHDPARFADLGLFHAYPAPADDAFAGRDPFGEIIAAARARWMQVHARWLDGWGLGRLEGIPGWDAVAARTPAGEALPTTCYGSERYREWWRRTVTELVERYPDLAGLYFGFERGSPLSDVLFHGQPPYCFCAACQDRARRHGLDIDEVRRGFDELQAVMHDTAGCPLVAALRVLWRHPALLVWDRLDRAACDAMLAEAGAAARAVRPGFRITALTHTETELVKAVHDDPGLLVPQVDALVARVYGHIGGAREVAGANASGGLLRGLSPAARLELGWWLSGAPGVPPPADILERDGWPVERHGQRVARVVAEAAGKPVLAAFGVDIAHPFPGPRPTPESYIHDGIASIRRAGAAGVILCREYQEIRLAAVRAASAAWVAQSSAG